MPHPERSGIFDSPGGLLGWLILGIVAGFRHMYLDAIKVSRTQTMPGAKPDAAKAPGKMGQRARLAQTLKGFSKGK